VLTPEMASKLETDSLDDLDELAQGMDELSDATDKLSDATGGLHKGLKKFQSYLRKYTKAIHTVRQGSEQLRKGLKTLNSHTEKLQAQMEEMEKNLPDHDAQQAEEKTPAELLREAQTALSKVSSFTQGVESYCQAVEGGKGSAIASLGGIDWSGMEENAAAAAREQVEQECAQAFEKLNLTDEEKAALTQRLTGCIDLTGATATAQEAAGEAQSALEGIPDASALIQGAKSLNSAVGELQGVLAQMEPYVEELPQLKKLSAAAIAYAQGVKQLSEGAGTMTDALKEMDKAGSKLNKAFSGGVKGAKKLAKAMKEFDEEGIEELNGQDVEELALRLRAVRQAGKDYQSFTGLDPGRSGRVRFIVETEEIREK
jgi:putative membrane protein